MTRDDVIAVIKKTAEELGHTPTVDDLVTTGKLRKHDIRRWFGPYRAALEACGLEPHRQGYAVSLDVLFRDWIGMVSELGRVPSLMEYELRGKYSVKPLTRHFGGWRDVPAGLMLYAQEQRLAEEWKAELEVVARHVQANPVKVRSSAWTPGSPSKPQLRLDEPIYGPPMLPTELLLAPTNEQGVLFLFGAVARKLGFAVLQVQTAYPDCRALREVEPGRWQMVNIEIEHESANFLTHGHDPAKCHLIVCWSHNWEECPVEVIELKSAVKKLTTE